MAQSSIEWTEATWNPVTGCTKISPGCDHCYAERMALRLREMGQANYRNGFELALQPQMLEHPLTWKKPRRIFVNSMSDLFHKNVPQTFIEQVFDVMRRAHWHQFQLLTKRAQRLSQLDSLLEWPPNVWMGVSVESEDLAWRADFLRKTAANVKFLSLEPLIGPIKTIDFTGIDWVIIGGESGPGARHMDPEWVLRLIEQGRREGVRIFFKQAGTRLARDWGCSDQKGTNPNDWPHEFRVRQYPTIEPEVSSLF